MLTWSRNDVGLRASTAAPPAFAVVSSNSFSWILTSYLGGQFFFELLSLNFGVLHMDPWNDHFFFSLFDSSATNFLFSKFSIKITISVSVRFYVFFMCCMIYPMSPVHSNITSQNIREVRLHRLKCFQPLKWCGPKVLFFIGPEQGIFSLMFFWGKMTPFFIKRLSYFTQIFYW